MLRILHTSDWHLGKRLDNYPRHEAQEKVLDEICRIADEQAVDAVLIAGDLFDTANPPVQSVELFYKTLKRLTNNGKRPVIAIAGNHDSPDRIEAPDPLARECGIIFSGYPQTEIPLLKIENGFEITRSGKGLIELKIENKPLLRVLLTPYANEHRLRTYFESENPEEELRDVLKRNWQALAGSFDNSNGVQVLLAHLLFMAEGGEIPPEPDDERSILHIGGAQAVFTSAIPGNIQYAALGHLHRKQTIANEPCPVVYCGSPLQYSFSEAGQKKTVAIVDLVPQKPVTVSFVELTAGENLERKRFESVDEAVVWLSGNPESLVELTVVTDTFLKTADIRRMREAHKHIIHLKPEIREQQPVAAARYDAVQQTGDFQQLFVEFFQHKKGQAPNDDILAIFKEIQAFDGEG